MDIYANRDNKINYVLPLIPIFLGRVQEFIPLLDKLHIAKIAMVFTLFVVFTATKNLSAANANNYKIPQVRYFMVITLLAILSVPFGVWPGASLDFLLDNHLKLTLFIYVLVWCVGSEDDIVKVFWSLILTVFAMDIACIVNPSLIDGRIYIGNTYDPNDLALLLVISVPILFYLIGASKGVRKVFLFTVLLTTVSMIFKTGSRGGLVALAAVAATLLYQNGFSYTVKRLPVMVALMLMALSFTPGAQKERLQTVFQEDYNTTERGGRLEIWKRGLSVMVRNPVLGCGVGQFVVANGKTADGTWQAAHNSFVQIGAELGFFGLIFFTMMIFQAWKSLSRAVVGAQDTLIVPAIKASLIGLVVGSCFLSWAYSYGTYFVIALTVIVVKIQGGIKAQDDNLDTA